jgi:hypothetical protein
METRDVFQRLAEDVREDPILLGLAAVGICLGLVEVVLIPAVKDIGSKVLEAIRPPLL